MQKALQFSIAPTCLIAGAKFRARVVPTCGIEVFAFATLRLAPNASAAVNTRAETVRYRSNEVMT